MTEQDLKKNMADRLWRLNNLYYIQDEDGKEVLFKCRTVQLLLYHALHWLNIILKSRQHGITTFCCIMMLDMCLFNSNTEAGIIAHNLKAAQEIFRKKIQYPYKKLPEALLRKITTSKNDAGHIIFSNESSIIVATSLRSGTYQWVHISEYGKICAKTPEKAIEIATGTLEAVHQGNFITIESTAEGSAGDFYDRCQEAEAHELRGLEIGPMDYKRHFFAWYQDPKNTTDEAYVMVDEKMNLYLNKVQEYIDATNYNIKLTLGQRAWYTAKKKKLKLLIYREHPSTPDEAFKAHIEGAYYGKDMAIARESGRICRVPYEKHSKVHTVWDLGHKHTAIWFVQFVGQEVRIIDFYMDTEGVGVQQYALMLQDKRYVYGKHYGPWDVFPKGPNSASMQTGREFTDVARDAGIDFVMVDKCSVEAGIKEVQDMLDSCWFDEERCDYGIRALEMYRAEWDESAGTYAKKPLHNWASHPADGFRYLAVMYRTASLHGKRVGETKQRIPARSGHSAYRPGIRKLA